MQESRDVSTTTGEFTRNGYFAVLVSFSVVFLSGGTFKSLGVLLPTLQDQFATNTWLIGTIISLLPVSMNIGSLLALPLEAKFGSRKALIASTLTSCTGLMSLSLATNLIHVALGLIVLVGPGLGVSTVLYRVILGRNFKNKYALASGLSCSGHAFAVLGVSSIAQLFLSTYGWRGAILLIGGSSMHAVAFATLPIKDGNEEQQYNALPIEEESANSSSSDSSSKTLSTRLFDTFQLSIPSEFAFWVACFCLSGTRFVDATWLEYYVPHLQAKGFSPELSASLTAAAGVGYLFGAISFAPLVDRGLMKCSSVVIVSSLTLALSLVVDPMVNNVVEAAAANFVYGLSMSSLFVLIDVLTTELVGRSRLTGTFAWIGVISAGTRVLSGFLPGWIYDTTGSYDLAFIILGTVPVVNIIPLTVGKLLNKI